MCVCVYIYYSTIRNEEILLSVPTWMEPEGIRLSEISQAEKNKFCMISLICGICKQTNNKTEKPSVKKRDQTCSGQGRRMRKEGIGGRWSKAQTPNCKVTEC